MSNRAQGMQAGDFFNRCEAERYLAETWRDGDVRELRCLDATIPGWRGKCTYGGFFNTRAAMLDAIEQVTSARGVYLTLNPLDDHLLGQGYNEAAILGKGDSAADTNVLRRDLLLVDADPVRPDKTKTATSDAEHEAARQCITDLDEYLSSKGWPAGIIIDSGNGYQAQYAVDLPADDEGLVQNCLAALEHLFGNEQVEIDTSVFNPSRITRLPGVMNCKGGRDGHKCKVPRPRRMARVVAMPEGGLQIVPRGKLEALAALAPIEPTPEIVGSNGKSYSGKFSLEAFMAKHAIGHRDAVAFRGTGKKYILDACVFNEAHTGTDAAFFIYPDGKLGYRCLHNSCFHLRWQEVREKFDGPREERYKQQIEPGVNRLVERMKQGQEPPKTDKPKATRRHMTMRAMKAAYPEQKQPVVTGLQRRGETMNVVSYSKLGKSWLIYLLAICVAAGRAWFGRFPTRQGNVLLIDNELDPTTITYRIPYVARALGIHPDEYEDRLWVISMRGDLEDIYQLGHSTFPHYKPGEVDMVILDAWYRLFPEDADENSNADVMRQYNAIDQYARYLDSAFTIVHHASKGAQGDKRVTDVGSGAGAQSRCADTHLILREHEEPNAVVMEAALRSWAPLDPVCLRWSWPLWELAPDLDPAAIKRERGRGGRPKKNQEAKGDKPEPTIWTAERYATEIVGEGQSIQAEIEARAISGGMTRKGARDWLDIAVARGLVFRSQTGRNTKATFSTSKPNEIT